MKIDKNHEFVQWVFEQHNAINHVYDSKGAVPLPYTFHLDLSAKVLEKPELQMDGIFQFLKDKFNIKQSEIIKALYAHDLLEDVPSRVSYNDLLKAPGIDSDGDNKVTIANLVFAVTNNTGKTRKERANWEYYEKIRNTPGATVIKMGDRIANVEYGLLTNNFHSVGMYRNEYPDFKYEIFFVEYKPLFDYLEKRLGL